MILKNPAIALPNNVSTPQVNRAKRTEKTATIIVKRCTSDQIGQVTFILNS